jgi:hypothetical protein
LSEEFCPVDDSSNLRTIPATATSSQRAPRELPENF